VKGLLLALSLLLATPCWAQVGGKVFIAGKGMELIVPMIASLVLASEHCGFGETRTWKRVVGAIDDRYRHCLAEDPDWAGLARGWEKQEQAAKARGSSTAMGSLAFEDFLPRGEVEVRVAGAAHYCASRPWRMALEPIGATDEAKAEFLRAKPTETAEGLEKFLSQISWLRALGSDQGWVKASCEEFWPMYSNTKK
jgi:hypothetical protein